MVKLTFLPSCSSLPYNVISLQRPWGCQTLHCPRLFFRMLPFSIHASCLCYSRFLSLWLRIPQSFTASRSSHSRPCSPADSDPTTTLLSAADMWTSTSPFGVTKHSMGLLHSPPQNRPWTQSALCWAVGDSHLNVTSLLWRADEQDALIRCHAFAVQHNTVMWVWWQSVINTLCRTLSFTCLFLQQGTCRRVIS